MNLYRIAALFSLVLLACTAGCFKKKRDKGRKPSEKIVRLDARDAFGPQNK